ncbi:hypothetical protein GCM10027290_50890 [Micromonospora sonneratiae]
MDMDHERMRHILDDPTGLSERAQRFLADRADRVPFDVAEGPTDAELRSTLGGLPGVDVEPALELLRRIQARYGGLRFRSVAWSFDEVVTLGPWPWDAGDYDSDDVGPMSDLLEHSVAHPHQVWLRGSGEVSYFAYDFTASDVPVFPSVDALLEAEAIYQECTAWMRVRPDELVSVDAIEAGTAGLTLLSEASGHTEQWWEQEGFRVHVWHTFAAVYKGAARSRWGIWAKDQAGEQAARKFLATIAE